MTTPDKKAKESHDEMPPDDMPDIFVAAATNNVAALKKSLKFVDVNIRDEQGLTPLHHAASMNCEEAIDILLTCEGVNPTIKDHFGRTAADVALEVLGPTFGSQVANRLSPYCHPDLSDDNDPPSI